MSNEGIYIVAPEGTAWPLTVPEVHEQVLARWPGAFAEVVDIGGHACLSFDVDVDGQSRNGLYVEGSNLGLRDGSPRIWAETIAWFLALLPPDAPVVCALEAVPTPVPLRRDAPPQEIVDVLEELDSR